MLNGKTLFDMSQMDITRTDPKTLADVGALTISQALPHEQKVLSVMEQMGNPYCFLSGNTPVRMRFINGGKALTDSLSNYFSQLKQK